ncbi:ribulose-5-phosphate 4-epimerase-like epimerase or aldolase [Corynebacterium mustelae]|uniref:Ribulose-5-phosphate 4-epimerase-like epimerase or aldolase n=1 Tax=Corynebacterium mustelae TaxID=571915 RepID=A0A0G3GZW7_9CORY|nr:class II aldolase/adducin family protein [Corynebacterium mustelae]AKK06676.1 ribulose-5-phosphate 4-epimerase-like epimerase or aldolase [Corynebacterium mustelae]
MTQNLPLPAILTDLSPEVAEEAKQCALEIIAAGDLVWQREMVAANDGNISARLSNGWILCTPTGISKRGMTLADLVLLDPSGAVIAGENHPSSEVKMHLRVYELAPEVHGVVHAHPTFATVFAVNGAAPPTDLVAETVVLMPTIPVAPFAVPSTQEVPDSISAIVPQSSVCLLEHHGALSWGGSVMDAYYQMERLEHVSKLGFYCKLIGADRSIAPERLAQIKEVFSL